MNTDNNSSTELPFVPADTQPDNQTKNDASSAAADTESRKSAFSLDENETPIMMIEETVDDEETIFKNGEYTSEQTVKDGNASVNITVTVRIENDIIADIKIDNANDNPEKIIEKIRSHRCEELDDDFDFGEGKIAESVKAALKDILGRAR